LSLRQAMQGNLGIVIVTRQGRFYFQSTA